MGSFPEAYDYPFVLTDSSQILLKGYRSASLIYRMAPISINNDSLLIPTFLSLHSLV